MPDWTYHTLLKHLVHRVPRTWLRAWGLSRAGRRIVRFMAAAPPDARLHGLASDDTQGIVMQLGVGATIQGVDGHTDPSSAIHDVLHDGTAVLDLARGGPGLARRVSEATRPGMERAGRTGFVLLGLGMVAAGLAAAVVAATRVVLPYDEAYVAIPEMLLPFLAHDRMTLAGTMVSIGIMYTFLGWFAGATAWVRAAMIASALVGFSSFFLYLGFGYFDPLHATVSAALFPFFVWGAWRRAPHVPGPALPDACNDAPWRAAQWGTLGMVGLGTGLIVGGAAIAAIGSTSVFVASDLEFIGGAPGDPDLVALVAHDRAGFGGALVSQGILVALTAMWGIRRGASWLWWAYAISATVGFGAAIAVHFWVGYVDAWHLFPVFVGAAVTAANLALLAPYMIGQGHVLERPVRAPAP